MRPGSRSTLTDITIPVPVLLLVAILLPLQLQAQSEGQTVPPAAAHSQAGDQMESQSLVQTRSGHQVQSEEDRVQTRSGHQAQSEEEDRVQTRSDVQNIQPDSGQAETLTLQETIDLAREHSPLARAARYRVQASKWSYQSFRADLLPGLSLSGNVPNYNRTFREIPALDGTTSMVYTQQSHTSAGLQINQPVMATGGDITVSSGISRLGIFPNENTYLWSSTPLVLGISQPLFQYNDLKWRHRMEPIRLQASQKEYSEEMESLSHTVTQRYFDVVLAQINLQISEYNAAVNDSIYHISTGRYNVGRIAENDLLQSELALRNAEASVTQARINYNQQIKSFRLLLGLESDAPLDVSMPEQVPDIHVDTGLALEMARQNNSSYLQFQLAETEAESNLERALRESSFSATIHANFGLNQTSSNFGNLYQEPLSQQFVTLGFQVPIFNWGKQRAEVSSARNIQRQVADEVAYQQAQLDLQIQSAVDEFRQLRDQVVLAQLSDGIATRRYEVSRNRYLIGRIDITNLLIAQNEHDAARRSYVQAMRNYWLGIYNLRRLTLYDFEQNEIIEYEV